MTVCLVQGYVSLRKALLNESCYKLIQTIVKMSCPNRNSFCFVCALFTPKDYVQNITKTVVQGFENFYLMPYQPNRWYVPEVFCDYCYRALVAIMSKSDTRHTMKYVSPTIWLSLFEHNPTECYFCLTVPNTFGFTYKTRDKLKYAVVESVIPARLRSIEHPYAPSEMETVEEDQGKFFFQEVVYMLIFMEYLQIRQSSSII